MKWTEAVRYSLLLEIMLHASQYEEPKVETPKILSLTDFDPSYMTRQRNSLEQNPEIVMPICLT